MSRSQWYSNGKPFGRDVQNSNAIRVSLVQLRAAATSGHPVTAKRLLQRWLSRAAAAAATACWRLEESDALCRLVSSQFVAAVCRHVTSQSGAAQQLCATAESRNQQRKVEPHSNKKQNKDVEFANGHIVLGQRAGLRKLGGRCHGSAESLGRTRRKLTTQHTGRYFWQLATKAEFHELHQCRC